MVCSWHICFISFHFHSAFIALSHFISFQGKTGQMLSKLWNSQYESRSTMNGSMIRNGSWASVGFFPKGLELRISARFAWAGLYCCSCSSLCISGHYEKDQHMKYLALEKIYAIRFPVVRYHLEGGGCGGEGGHQHPRVSSGLRPCGSYCSQR